jgi:hypothetical protein
MVKDHIHGVPTGAAFALKIRRTAFGFFIFSQSRDRPEW